MNRSRPVSDAGFLPLRWTEIEAWARLYRVEPRPWELDILTELDDLWLTIMRKKTVSAEDLRPEGSKDEDDAKDDFWP